MKAACFIAGCFFMSRRRREKTEGHVVKKSTRGVRLNPNSLSVNSNT